MIYPVADFYLLFIQTVSASDAHVQADVFVYTVDFDFLDLFATFWTISWVQLNVGIQTLLIEDFVAIITLNCRSDVNEIYADATNEILRNTLVVLDNIFHGQFLCFLRHFLAVFIHKRADIAYKSTSFWPSFDSFSSFNRLDGFFSSAWTSEW